MIEYIKTVPFGAVNFCQFCSIMSFLSLTLPSEQLTNLFGHFSAVRNLDFAVAGNEF